MAKNLKARKRIKHDGEFYNPGEVIEGVEQGHAQRLVNLGAAEFIGEAVHVVDTKTPDDNNDELGNAGATNTKTPDGSDEDEEDELGDIPGIDELSDEEVIELIDAHFKLDPLKEEAASIGLEFPGNISKAKLIRQILDKEKEQHFLDQIPE